jgi:hypothetical protein
MGGVVLTIDRIIVLFLEFFIPAQTLIAEVRKLLNKSGRNTSGCSNWVPLLIFFVEESVPTKKRPQKSREETRRPYFWSIRKNTQTVFSFQTVRQSYLFRFLSHARIHAIDVTNAISHVMDASNVISHATHATNAILHARHATNSRHRTSISTLRLQLVKQ